MRILTGATLVALLAIPVPTQAADRKEYFLKYRLSVNIEGEVGYGGQHVNIFDKSEKGELPPLIDEPSYHAEPLYGVLKLGVNQERMHLVLDNSTGQKTGYDTLYVDGNRSRRLTTATKLRAIEHGRSRIFGPMKVLVDAGPERCPQWFLFRLQELQVDGKVRHSLTAINAGYYQGLVTFGDQKCLVAVVDANGNGLYNDTVRDGTFNCDRLLIDENNDGKLDGSYDSDEVQPLSRYVAVGDKYWKLEVAADGSSLFVEPLQKPLVSIQSDQKDFTVLVSGDEGVFRIRSQDGSARLPVGSYRLTQCRYRMDKAGERWEFSAFRGQKGADFQVVAGKTAQLPMGPPLVPKVLLTLSGRDLELRLELRGDGGEVLNDVHVGAGERPPVPKVRITSSDGRELAMLDFHYG